MFLHVLLAGVWIFMSLQGLVGCLPFVGYNFLGFGSPQPPVKWLHGVDSPGIRTSRRSVSCPRRLRRNTRSRVETSVPGAPGVTVGVFFFFRVGGRDVTWSSLGCLKLHVTACCHHEFSIVSENWSPLFLVGKTKGNSIWRDRNHTKRRCKIKKEQGGCSQGNANHGPLNPHYTCNPNATGVLKFVSIMYPSNIAGQFTMST